MLFDADRQMLFDANPSAVFLWCCIAEAMPVDDIVRILGERGLTAKEAARYIASALQDWRENGLLNSNPAAATVQHGNPQRTANATPFPDLVPARPPARFRLLDTDFSIVFASETLHAAVAPMFVAFRPSATASGGERLAVTVADGRYIVHHDGGHVSDCVREDELVPLVLAMLAQIAVHRSPSLCAIHAGAVGTGDGCILLAGEAGAGKSTLVAGLAAAGLPALCDDTVLLADDTLEAQPLGGTICIKEGSWAVLSDAYPGLSELPRLRRPDGRIVRYLPCPTAGTGSAGDRYRVQGIVYPRFDPAATEATTAVLEPAASASRLMTSMFFMERRLDANAVERLVRWVSDLPSVEMRYASLADAVRLFRSFDGCRSGH